MAREAGVELLGIRGHCAAAKGAGSAEWACSYVGQIFIQYWVTCTLQVEGTRIGRVIEKSDTHVEHLPPLSQHLHWVVHWSKTRKYNHELGATWRISLTLFPMLECCNVIEIWVYYHTSVYVLIARKKKSCSFLCNQSFEIIFSYCTSLSMISLQMRRSSTFFFFFFEESVLQQIFL